MMSVTEPEAQAIASTGQLSPSTPDDAIFQAGLMRRWLRSRNFRSAPLTHGGPGHIGPTQLPRRNREFFNVQVHQGARLGRGRRRRRRAGAARRPSRRSRALAGADVVRLDADRAGRHHALGRRPAPVSCRAATSTCRSPSRAPWCRRSSIFENVSTGAIDAGLLLDGLRDRPGAGRGAVRRRRRSAWSRPTSSPG